MERDDVIQGLRELADFLEQHPDVPAPAYNTLNAQAWSKEALTLAARAASWTKDYNDNYFSLRRMFPGYLTFDVYVERNTICRKVVTGTRLEPAQPEREVETYERVCDEPLLAVK